MVRKDYPPFPPFHSLRLATARDIPRMASLSVMGFKDSEIFRFERPQYDKFPQDAEASFANIYRSQLLDPRAIVIVAEEWRCPDEPPNGTDLLAYDAERIIVGVGSWILPEGSPRTGQFVVPNVPDLLPSPDRDMSQRRWAIFDQISEATEAKFFAGKTVCNKLVVHPSYRRRGHATSILKWGLQLSEMDQVDQGVIPADMGEPLYLHLGYEVIGEMEIPDDGEVKGFTQRVTVYKAGK